MVCIKHNKPLAYFVMQSMNIDIYHKTRSTFFEASLYLLFDFPMIGFQSKPMAFNSATRSSVNQLFLFWRSSWYWARYCLQGKWEKWGRWKKFLDLKNSIWCRVKIEQYLSLSYSLDSLPTMTACDFLHIREVPCNDQISVRRVSAQDMMWYTKRKGYLLFNRICFFLLILYNGSIHLPVETVSILHNASSTVSLLSDED